MNDTDANWLDTLTAETHTAAVNTLHVQIQIEAIWPQSVVRVLRNLPPHELRTVINVFEKMRAERLALA